MNSEDLKEIIAEDKRNLDIMVGEFVIDLCKQFDDKFHNKKFKIYDDTKSTGWFWNRKKIVSKQACISLDMPPNMVHLFGMYREEYYHQLYFRTHIEDFELNCHKIGINELLGNKIKAACPDNSYEIRWNEFHNEIYVDIKINE